MSVFRQSAPLLVTSFINKCGTIGMSLLPMLLVSRHFSSSESTLVMTMVKTSLVAGTFIGGWTCDRLGMKKTITISFSLAALGLGLMPFGVRIEFLCLFAIIGQLGQAMFQSPARLLITELVEAKHQQESMGWLRATNNLGQIVSYSIGFLFSGLGVGFLMAFDAITSLAAAVVGWKKLPDRKDRMSIRSELGLADNSGEPSAKATWNLFLLCTMILTGFYFLYELFMVSTAALCEIHYGDTGLKVFSRIMVANTVLCALFGIAAAKGIRNPKVVFPLGILLVAVGLALVASGMTQTWKLAVGTLVFTAGEIIFTALGQYVLIRVTPAASGRGAIYSLSLVVQSLGRILGGALAFPLIIHGPHPVWFIAASSVIVLLLSFLARPGLNRYMSQGALFP